MRLSTVALIIAGLTGAIVLAQPLVEKPAATTIQCLDARGQEIQAVCQAPGARLSARGSACACPSGGQRIEVAVCAKDHNPPADGDALNRARREAMLDGSLMGDSVNGQAICVLPRTG